MSTQAPQTNEARVRTGEVRFSYLTVFGDGKPEVNGKHAGKPKYSTAILIPKTDTATVATLKKAIKAVLDAKFGPNNPKTPKIVNPLKDGDGEKPRGGDYGDECKGHWVLNASTYTKPAVVHRKDINKQLADGEMVSGDYGFAVVNAYWFEVDGNKGVTFGLGNICMTRRGEPLGSRRSAEDDFADVAGDDTGEAGATGAGAKDDMFA